MYQLWDKNGLTSGQKWPNFGAKRAQLQKPDNWLQAIAGKMLKKQHWFFRFQVGVIRAEVAERPSVCSTSRLEGIVKDAIYLHLENFAPSLACAH